MLRFLCQPGHHRLRQRAIAWLLRITALSCLIVCLVLLPVQGGAHADITIHKDNQGRLLYKSRASIRDQAGYVWQVIAFKWVKPSGEVTLQLRLVGFPGVVNLARTQPLRLRTALGNILTAADTSDQIAAEAQTPKPLESHVGQYDLMAILGQISVTLPVQLQIPTTFGEPQVLTIPPALLEEWQMLAQQTEPPSWSAA